ncbi:MAG: hypothetical protein AAGA84_09750 [Pseudomonadota bacterium]
MRNTIAMIVLFGLAVLAPLANLAGFAPLQAVALATQASPAMKVFTSHDGYETFSPRFHLHWTQAGEPLTLTLTPAVYANLLGPYNRRNAYGAVLSYSPVLSAQAATRQMHAAVTHYALCGDAPVLTELGIDRDRVDGALTVRIEPRRHIDSKWILEYEVSCDG